MKNSNISFSEFCDSFSEQYKNNFSYQGKRALYDYLTDYEEATGQEIELDPIAFCCEYSEYENLDELKKNYNNVETLDDLKEQTTVIEIEGSDSFIIQDY